MIPFFLEYQVLLHFRFSHFTQQSLCVCVCLCVQVISSRIFGGPWTWGWAHWRERSLTAGWERGMGLTLCTAKLSHISFSVPTWAPLLTSAMSTKSKVEIVDIVSPVEGAQPQLLSPLMKTSPLPPSCSAKCFPSRWTGSVHGALKGGQRATAGWAGQYRDWDLPLQQRQRRWATVDRPSSSKYVDRTLLRSSKCN